MALPARLVVCATLAPVLAACGLGLESEDAGDKPFCTAGRRIVCVCQGGAIGTMACADDGRSWQDCECSDLGDAGAGQDAWPADVSPWDDAASADAREGDASARDAAVRDQPAADAADSDVAVDDAGQADRIDLDGSGQDAPGLDRWEPDAAGVDVVSRDAAGPDLAARDRSGPDLVRPDTPAPDLAVPDAWPRDAAPPDLPSIDSARPDLSGPDLSPPDQASPDLALPDTARPDAATPDAGLRDAASPDQAAPDAAGPDTAYVPVVTWVEIPGGSYEMGCSPGDEDCTANESPRHTVTMAPFELLETEVTQGHYLAVTGENPSYFSSSGGGAVCGLDCPVEQVGWFEAKAFCEAIGGRLPSEAEWEYAARAGSTTRFPCGDDTTCVDALAWYADNSKVGTFRRTHPVGTKELNAFGLYDMVGNVWEWNEDCWHPYYTGAPPTGEVWTGGDCTTRMFRGGAWSTSALSARLSARAKITPETVSSNIGFRCAR